jgi:peptidoglycan hydrolase-like protein with peptidoglycan-binding domain
VLTQGSTGPAVTALQQALHVSPVGTFGPLTRAAVVALQKRAGLVADGVVGPMTWAAVDRHV